MLELETNRVPTFKPFDVLLTIYDIALIDQDFLYQFPWHYAIIDEAQRLKPFQPSSRCTKSEGAVCDIKACDVRRAFIFHAMQRRTKSALRKHCASASCY